MVTSLRTPSTCWAYQTGKESLSPEVISTPYGSTDCRRSRAHSAVKVCPLRDASRAFVTTGMNAISNTGDANSHPRMLLCLRLLSMRVASHCHTAPRPKPAQMPHVAKVQRKK